MFFNKIREGPKEGIFAGFKVGDKVILKEDPDYGSWSGVKAIIVNFGDLSSVTLKRENDNFIGITHSLIFRKASLEIKLFEDE